MSRPERSAQQREPLALDLVGLLAEDRSEAGEVEQLAAMGIGHQANSTGRSG